MKTRILQEIFLLPYFHFLRVISHIVICYYNYRGIDPSKFRENWENWLIKEQKCFRKMNDLPMLNPAIVILNAIVAALIGLAIMLWWQVPIILRLIYLSSCIACASIYYVEKLKGPQLFVAITQIPVYLLRIVVSFLTSNGVRAINVLINVALINFMLHGLKLLIGDTFLFYHIDLPYISLALLLTIVICKKLLYFSEIIYNRKVYLNNVRRMRGKVGITITQKKFYIEIMYSLSYGTAAALFSTTLLWLYAVLIIKYFSSVDIMNPIGLFLLWFVISASESSTTGDFHFYTSHKFVHANPYFNIFHLEHHLTFPVALIGNVTAGSGILEGALRIPWLIGSLPGWTVLRG